MILDSSAIVALLTGEEEAAAIAAAIEAANVRRISAATLLETAIVLDLRRDDQLSASLDLFLAETGCEIVPVDETQARLARAAFRHYGRGSGHEAGLNFGDCFAYALARHLREPLLFKGADFAATDVTSAL